LLLAHRQAFCWTDEWYSMTYEKIVEYEQATYSKTNAKVLAANTSLAQNEKNNDTEKDLCDFD
jgi:hypothetical protein